MFLALLLAKKKTNKHGALFSGQALYKYLNMLLQKWYFLKKQSLKISMKLQK
jgi:hypothetical protein